MHRVAHYFMTIYQLHSLQWHRNSSLFSSVFAFSYVLSASWVTYRLRVELFHTIITLAESAKYYHLRILMGSEEILSITCHRPEAYVEKWLLNLLNRKQGYAPSDSHVWTNVACSWETSSLASTGSEFGATKREPELNKTGIVCPLGLFYLGSSVSFFLVQGPSIW
jgi:hypothetical protein